MRMKKGLLSVRNILVCVLTVALLLGGITKIAPFISRADETVEEIKFKDNLLVAIGGTELDLTSNLAEGSTLKTETGYTTTWTISDTDKNMAEVNNDGKVKGKAKGNVTVTVSVTKTEGEGDQTTVLQKGTAIVKVYQPLNAVRLTESYTANVKSEKVIDLKFTPDPADADIDETSITWTSSVTDVLEMAEDSSGTNGVSATIKKAGQSNISVSVKDIGGNEKKSNDMKVDVKEPVGSVTITGGSTVEAGKTISLTAEVTPSGALDGSVTWESSDTSVATVASGTVTGVKSGTVTITATAKGAVGDSVSATHQVTVLQPVTDIGLKANPKSTIAVGETTAIEITPTPSEATVPTATYKSSDTGIATVDASGNVKGVKGGKATITVTIPKDEGKNQNQIEKSIEITVDDSLVYITTTSIPSGIVGTKYTDVILAASGGSNLEWTWKAASGSKLPPGLDLSKAGKITGTPTEKGEFKVEITATGTGSNKDVKEFTIAVTDKLLTVPDIDAKNVDTKVKEAAVDTGKVEEVIKNHARYKDETFTSAELIVEPKKSVDGSSAMNTAIRRVFGGMETSDVRVNYLDIRFDTKKNGTATSSGVLSDLGTPIEIVLTVDGEMTKNYMPVVFRYHNDEVQRFKKLDSRQTDSSKYEDASYWYESGKIYLYTRYFSGYAIAYPAVETVTVTFETNGGSAVEDMIVTLNGRLRVNPETPTRDGYRFDGWYTDNTLTTKWSTTTTFGTNSTLYAGWTSTAKTAATTEDGLRSTNSPQTSDVTGAIRMIGYACVLLAGITILTAKRKKK